MQIYALALASLLLIQANIITSYINQVNSGPFIHPRISNSQEVRPGKHPFIVIIQRGFGSIDPYVNVCAGSIIHVLWILTAAHCFRTLNRFDRRIFRIKAGKHHRLVDDEFVQTIEIIKRIRHEDYKDEPIPSKAPNDIGLGRLDSELVLNDRVQIINLPRTDKTLSDFAIMVGWGTTKMEDEERVYPDYLHAAAVSTIDNEACYNYMQTLPEDFYREISDKHLCTGPIGGSISACDGDSGGPLVQFVSSLNELTLTGIIAWGLYPCGLAGSPTVHTRVHSFIDWIDDKMASYQPSSNCAVI